jgi:hypothetical protein
MANENLAIAAFYAECSGLGKGQHRTGHSRAGNRPGACAGKQRSPPVSYLTSELAACLPLRLPTAPPGRAAAFLLLPQLPVVTQF